MSLVKRYGGLVSIKLEEEEAFASAVDDTNLARTTALAPRSLAPRPRTTRPASRTSLHSARRPTPKNPAPDVGGQCSEHKKWIHCFERWVFSLFLLGFLVLPTSIRATLRILFFPRRGAEERLRPFASLLAWGLCFAVRRGMEDALSLQLVLWNGSWVLLEECGGGSSLLIEVGGRRRARSGEQRAVSSVIKKAEEQRAESFLLSFCSAWWGRGGSKLAAMGVRVCRLPLRRRVAGVSPGWIPCRVELAASAARGGARRRALPPRLPVLHATGNELHRRVDDFGSNFGESGFPLWELVAFAFSLSRSWFRFSFRLLAFLDGWTMLSPVVGLVFLRWGRGADGIIHPPLVRVLEHLHTSFSPCTPGLTIAILFVFFTSPLLSFQRHRH
ncbi:hypothetical protein B0H13DRAFT_2336923 [Mycena leptocephala]|nr:hypothetical protein B0H13DRAFT_2336923 [Mycena leptocephala]